MGVLDQLFPRRRENPKQLLSDDLVKQTQDMLSQLVEHRKAQGLTQSDVAEKLGLTRTAITHFERYDSDPKISTLIRYALAVGARIDIDVSDGMRWAKDKVVQEKLGELGSLGASSAAEDLDQFRNALETTLKGRIHA